MNRRVAPARLAAIVLAVVGAPAVGAVETTLVAAGATWRYLDDGSDQGTGWRAAAFDDSGWAEGAAELGYGDGDEATVISYGGNASAKYTTTYFRRSFTATGVGAFTRADLGLLRDDGAVVYLNGVEVLRSNLPAGAISSSTFASTAIASPEESSFYPAFVDPALLVEGTNVLAVEVHQANLTSSDVSFDLSLTASDGPPKVVRGPYLQLATPTAISVRWRTDLPTESVVRWGAAPETLDEETSVAGSRTEHEVRITSLAPESTVYYSVGNGDGALAGGDADHAFVLPPTAGSAVPTRVWVLGDSGTANADARAVRDAFLGWSGGAMPDLWLMLGDNAYDDGTDEEYQDAVFDTYPTVLRRSPLWPTLGNHDGHTASSASQSGPYYDAFTLPTAGEAGGEPSGTEAYYSFDRANLHFVCLDSYETDRSPGGAMLTWLEDDLAATTAEWVIAFWHHPPYSKGSHDSDSDARMTDMREDVLPILEGYGVDLVLTGHSHSYERSHLLDGHYETSDLLDPSMLLDTDGGDADSGHAYSKPTHGPAPHEGAIYAVAGSSGKTSAAPLDHPVMFASLLELGSVVLDADGPVLDVTFLDDAGAELDAFRIVKGSEGPTGLEVASTSHTVGTWSTDPSIDFVFSGAEDPNGVAGYALAFDGSAATDPGTGVDQASTSHEASAASDGEWTLHVRACDHAGYCGSAVHSGPYGIDTAAPGAPGSFGSTSHPAGTPVSDPTIDLAWDAAVDATSGVTLYRWEVAPAALGEPACTDLSQTTPSTGATTGTLADGAWVARACAVDAAGLAGPIATATGLMVDTTPPGGLTPSSSSHTVSTWSNDPTVDFLLAGATDANGVAGYSIVFDPSAATIPDSTVDQAGTSYEGTASVDGASWTLHARACDGAGNCGATAHLGPFPIDTVAPSVDAIGSVADTGDGVLGGGESTRAGITRLVASFDDPPAESSATSTGRYRLVEAGLDDTLETVACAGPVAGSDVEVTPASATWLAGPGLVAVTAPGNLALPAGRYRWLVCGTLEDPAGNALGADVSADFRVVGSNVLVDPNFDASLDGWTVVATVPEEVGPDALEDADGSPASGSAKISTTSGTGESWELAQCVELDAVRVVVSGAVAIEGGVAGAPQASVVLDWSSDAECGAPLGTGGGVVAEGATAGWSPFEESIVAPSGTMSVRFAVRADAGAAGDFVARFDRLSLQDAALFADGFESGALTDWSAASP